MSIVVMALTRPGVPAGWRLIRRKEMNQCISLFKRENG